MTEQTVSQMLIEQFKNGNILDSGYNTPHGRYYVEIMDCHFIVDRGVIFPNIPAYENMGVDEWYMENYYPLIEPQLDTMIEQLNNNKWSRRAVLTYNNPNDIGVCTNYTNCLIRKSTDSYLDTLHYFVHMRANDVVEYRTDCLWHKYVANNIIIPRLNFKVDKTVIHWNADTFHWYVN